VASQLDSIFKPAFYMTGVISQDRESCQFLSWVDEKSNLGPGGSGICCSRFAYDGTLPRSVVIKVFVRKRKNAEFF